MIFHALYMKVESLNNFTLPYDIFVENLTVWICLAITYTNKYVLCLT